MNEQEKLQAIGITKDIKNVMRGLLSKHAAAVSMLHKGNDDPHSPIVGCAQMALAQSCVEFSVTCGCTPNEAVKHTVDNIQSAMNQWLNSILRTTEKPKPGIIKP